MKNVILKNALAGEGINQDYLAELLGRSARYISERMRFKRSWELEDVFKIMELIHEPNERIEQYFKNEGKTKTEYLLEEKEQ